MLEANQPVGDSTGPSVAAVYPLLAYELPRTLYTLDLGLARASSEWQNIVEALTNIAIQRSKHSFADLVPSLPDLAALDVADDCALELLGIVPLSTRSLNVLRYNHLDTWGEVGGVSPTMIGGFVNAGVKVIRDIARLAIELGAMAALGLGERRLTIRPTFVELSGSAGPAVVGQRIDGDLMQSLASWGLSQPGVLTLGDVLDRAASNHSVPADVVDAVNALRALSLQSLVTTGLPSLAVLLEELFGEFNDTEQEIMRRRVFTVTPVTLKKVSADLGLTSERIRQIQNRAEGQIESILATSRFAPLHWAATALQSTLGSVAPFDVAQREIEALLIDVTPEDVIAGSILLRRLAGPYHIERGYYITKGAGEIEKRLLAAADLHGIISMGSVADVFREFGVLPIFQEEAIGFFEHFRRFGDSLVVWPNNGVDKLVAMLAMRGQPADTETLLSECGEDYSARSLHNRLSEDPRVVRVNRREWGLTEWGLEEYSSITKEIVERIERSGGRARLAEIVTEVAPFGVRESSVRMYAEAPMFVIEGEWVRLRESDEELIAVDLLHEARRTYRISPGTLAYVVEIDRDALRGSGRALPRGTAVALDIQPGTKAIFAGTNGDVVVSWALTSINGPTIGSLRSHVLAHGLKEGDVLRVLFDTVHRTVTSVGVHSGDLVGLGPSARAERVTGIVGLGGPNVYNALIEAIEGEEGTLQRSLIVRGDYALLELLPDNPASPELSEALASLARVLGKAT